MSGYDVVVVGARAAGAATAMLLARGGARVALLDRGGEGTDTVSTHALMRAGVLQLSRWGLLDAVVAAGTPPVHRTTFHYGDGEPVRVTLRPGPGVPALYAPRRHLLDQLLVEAARAAGVEVHHRTVVTDLLRAGDGRVTGVRTQDGSRERDLSARHVVGADGVGSRVAREVAAPVLAEGRHASAVRYAYVRDLPADGYEWAYGDGAAAGVIPTNAGRSCVFVATTPELMRRTLRAQGPDGAFADLLRRAAPELAGLLATAPRDGRLHGWAGLRGYVRRSWGPGWSLVGDAGYYKDPISTHGLTDALRDAELLSAALLDTLTGVRAEREALAGFQGRRDELSHGLFAASDRIASYDWSGREVQPELRRLSAAMADEVELLGSRPWAGAGVTADVRAAQR